MLLAYHSSDARTGDTTDNGSFEAVTEDCAKYGSARSPDEGSLAGTDAALIAVTVVILAVVVLAAVVPAVVVLAVVVLAVVVPAVVVPAIVAAGVVVLPTSAAAANAPVERLVVSVIAMVIPVLRTSGKDAGGE